MSADAQSFKRGEGVAAGRPAGRAVQLQRQGHVLGGGQPGEEVEVLEDVADGPAPQASPGLSATCPPPPSPPTSTSPLVGSSSVPAIVSSVLLPDPLGPMTASRVAGLHPEVDVVEGPHLCSAPRRRTSTPPAARGMRSTAAPRSVAAGPSHAWHTPCVPRRFNRTRGAGPADTLRVAGQPPLHPSSHRRDGVEAEQLGVDDQRQGHLVVVRPHPSTVCTPASAGTTLAPVLPEPPPTRRRPAAAEPTRTLITSSSRGGARHLRRRPQPGPPTRRHPRWVSRKSFCGSLVAVLLRTPPGRHAPVAATWCTPARR